MLVPSSGVVPLCAASTALTDTSCVWPDVPYVGAGNASFAAEAADAAAFLVQNFAVVNITATRCGQSSNSVCVAAFSLRFLDCSVEVCVNRAVRLCMSRLLNRTFLSCCEIGPEGGLSAEDQAVFH